MHPPVSLRQLFYLSCRIIPGTVVYIPKLQLYLFFLKKTFILYKFPIEIGNILFLIIAGDHCA